MGLFDEVSLLEITYPDYPGERLVTGFAFSTFATLKSAVRVGQPPRAPPADSGATANL